MLTVKLGEKGISIILGYSNFLHHDTLSLAITKLIFTINDGTLASLFLFLVDKIRVFVALMLTDFG